jgi:outer membrane protein W
MKNLLKLFVVVVVLSMATESFAQTFGIRAGFNLSNMVAKDDNNTYSDDYKMKSGFQIGATAEFPITDIFLFETGLILTTKGFKISESSDGMDYDGKLNLMYFEIPITGKAVYEVGDMQIYGIFGPYIGFGLSGKSKYESNGNSTEESIDWGSNADEDDLKRFDFGLIVGAGVEIQSIQAGISYGFGLTNISPESDGGYKDLNRVLAITVGYKLKQK